MNSMEEYSEEGIVESAEKGTALVRIIAKGSCEDCSAKIFCSTSEDKNIVSAKDIYGVQKGDEVRISVPGKNITKASSLLYGVPLLLLIAGMLAGNMLFTDSKELFSAVLSLALIGIYSILLYFYLNKKDHSSVMPRIIFVKRSKGA